MTEITQALTDAGWTPSADGKAIEKQFRFASFRAAIGWMVRAAFEAEAMDHHPEWFNVWNKVVVDLNTHSAGGITELDFELASRMNRLADS